MEAWRKNEKIIIGKKKYVRNCRIKEKREKYEGKKIKNGRIICIDEGKKKTEE